jgi:hypothetical protein
MLVVHLFFALVFVGFVEFLLWASRDRPLTREESERFVKEAKALAHEFSKPSK